MKNVKKLKKPYSSQFLFFGGIALCLLSIIFIMNIGVVTRVFTYCFYYGFGIGTLFLFFMMYFLGIYFIFAKHSFQIKYKIRYFGIFFTFIFFIALISQCYSSSDNVILSLTNNKEGSLNFVSWFNECSKVKDGGYLKAPYVDIFDKNHFAGGFFGYFFVGLLNELFGVGGSYAIIIILLLCSLCLLFGPELVLLSKHLFDILINKKNKNNSEEIFEENGIQHEDEISLENSKTFNNDFNEKENETSLNLNKENSQIISSNSNNLINPSTLLTNPSSSLNHTDDNQLMNQDNIVFSNSVSKANLFDGDNNYFEVNKNISSISSPNDNLFSSNNNVNKNIDAENKDIHNDSLNNFSNQSSSINSLHTINNLNSNSQSNGIIRESSIKKEQLTLDFEDNSNQYSEINSNKIENSKIEQPKINSETILENSIPVFQDPIVIKSKADNNISPNNISNQTISSNSNTIIPLDGSRKPRVDFVSPSFDLLNDYEISEQIEKNNALAEQRKYQLNEIFKEFNIDVSVEDYIVGPGVTRFNIKYGPSVTSSSVSKRIEDISIRLGGVAVRFEPVVAGQIYSGLEIPNAVISTVGFKEVVTSLPSTEKHPLAVAFGKNITGEVVWADFNKFPHALLAGTTGSGKSIFIHSVIVSLIMRNSPDDLKLMLIDPKRVEMMNYEGLPHLLCPVIIDPNQAKVGLSKLIDEMERRYTLFTETKAGREIEDYNRWADVHNVDRLPYIIAFIDEFADLVDTCKEVSGYVSRIAAKSRACGIHLFIATQRPSSNIITGTIKSNLPTHIALMCGSFTDSTTIINVSGAEKLLGKGDMLVQCPLISRVGLSRLQGCYIDSQEIIRIVDYLKSKYQTEYNPDFLDLVDHSKEEGQAIVSGGFYSSNNGNEEDAKYNSIKEWVMSQEYTSMSKIQRECSVGFNKAGRIFKRLQEEGIVSSTSDGAKGSKVLVHGDNARYDDGSNDFATSDELTFRR